MTQHYSWLVTPSPLRDDFPYPDLGSSKKIAASLGPRATAHTTDIEVSAADITKIINKQGYLYIWGWARYKDIFGKVHITRYCTHVIGFDGNPLSGDSNEFVRPLLENCGTNCYDDECQVQ